jgi:hypothetical protein
MHRRLAIVAFLLGGWALASWAAAPELTSEEPAPGEAPAEPAVTEEEWEEPIYRPPNIRRPGSRLSGGTRGPHRRTLVLLAPTNHAGRTTSPQPSLYWYLSETTTMPIELVIQEENSVQPLVLRTLPTPAAAGYHGVSLQEIGASLREGVLYEWSIALVTDTGRRSRDAAVAQALILSEPSKALSLRATKLRRGQLAGLYAEAGYWYDAIEAASRGVETYPQLAGPRRQRESLGKQVALNLP